MALTQNQSKENKDIHSRRSLEIEDKRERDNALYKLQSSQIKKSAPYSSYFREILKNNLLFYRSFASLQQTALSTFPWIFFNGASLNLFTLQEKLWGWFGSREMEKEEGKTNRATTSNRIAEPDFLLQWGNRKRLRCVKIKDEDASEKSDGGGSSIRKKTTSRIDRRVVKTDKDTPPPPSPYRFPTKNGDSTPSRSICAKSQSCSPEKEDRYYTTRGSLLGFEDTGKMFMETGNEEKGLVWPRLFISLSSKEKEEDFMAMKGCKLPQRPKKRAKLIQRSLLLVSPGAWLSDLCQERYEVREKKTSKKRPRGLKAMGSMESDSE